MDSFRERILSAVFAALERVPDVELAERNRQDDVDDSVRTCLLFFDGDVVGETDRPQSWQRNPVFPMTMIMEIWGGIQGGAGNPGTLINDLYARTLQTLWTDPQLRQLLSENSIGLRIEESSFRIPKNPGAAKVAAFQMVIALPFEFDPTDP
jgi:hypothetical protein